MPNPFSEWRKPVVGMVHLLPLPGSAAHRDEGVAAIVERAVSEARTLADGGVDAILVQNTGDAPFTHAGGPATIACMTAAAIAIARDVRCPLGVNILANGGAEALAVAHAVGACFVRIKVYCGAVVSVGGIVEGNAAETLAFRRAIGADHVAIAADVYDRTSAPLGDMPIALLADLAHRHGQADALVVTGDSVEDSLSRIREVKTAVPSAIVFAGGGTTAENVGAFLAAGDGVIVGSSVKDTGGFVGRIDRARLEIYMRAAEAARGRVRLGV
jgi:membrane complex biogenesis BtpA family protein